MYLCVAKTSRGTAEEPRGFDFFFFSFPSKVVDLTLRNVSQECLQRQIAFCFLHYRQMWDVSAQARCCCCWSFSHRGVMRSLGPLTTAQQQLSRIDICGSWYVPALLFSCFVTAHLHIALCATGTPQEPLVSASVQNIPRASYSFFLLSQNMWTVRKHCVPQEVGNM